MSPSPPAAIPSRWRTTVPDRVRVRFESGELRSRITVELIDGALVPQIEEE